jgi:hypothetical protein
VIACWATAPRYLALTRAPFSVDSVTELGVLEPTRPGAVGAIFLAAHRAGLIAPVGYQTSTRPSRHAGVIRDMDRR